MASGRKEAKVRQLATPDPPSTAAQFLPRPSPACAPPASPHLWPGERRCAGQSTSCPARSCHHSRCRRRRSPAGQAHGQSGFSLGCKATGSRVPLGTMGSCWQWHQELGCQGPTGSRIGRRDTWEQWQLAEVAKALLCLLIPVSSHASIRHKD